MKRFPNVTALLAVLGLFSGACGGTPYEERSRATSGQSGGFNFPENPSDGGDFGGLEDDPPVTSFEPSYTYDFVLQGEDLDSTSGDDRIYESPGVPTDSILKVRITGTPADEDHSEGYSASYGCVQYKVAVNGQSVTTDVLKVQGGDDTLCPNAPESQVIDFSSRLGGASDVEVKVSNPRYDFYCALWWQQFYTAAPSCGYNYGCQVEWATYMAGSYNSICTTRHLHYTHHVTGQLEIETNGASN